MAAISGGYSGTYSSENRRRDAGLTVPVVRESDEELQVDADRFARKTNPEVRKEEKGEAGDTDWAETRRRRATEPAVSQRDVAKRRDIATKLESLAGAVRQNRGKMIDMAADLQVLRRKLADAHRALREMPKEANYRSIIALVESDMEVLDWKTASEDQLRRIEKTLAVGTKDAGVTYDDYVREMKLFENYRMPSLPTFNLGDEELDYIEPE